MSGLSEGERDAIREAASIGVARSRVEDGTPIPCIHPRDQYHVAFMVTDAVAPIVAELLAAREAAWRGERDELRARAWDEGYLQAKCGCGPFQYAETPNPYRTEPREQDPHTDWLRNEEQR